MTTTNSVYQSSVLSVFYPIEGDPRNMCVGGTQSSGHGSVSVHQLVSQTALNTGVNTGPGDRGSVQLETLRHQDRASVTTRSHNTVSHLFLALKASSLFTAKCRCVHSPQMCSLRSYILSQIHIEETTFHSS